VYERAVTQGELLIIEDLTTSPCRTPLEEKLVQSGVRNMVVAPLYYQDALIGTLDLVSPHPGDLHALNTLKLREVLPLFSMAIKRGMDELNTRVQAVIKEQCTAIHPTVEWRFRHAARHWMHQRKAGVMAEMEPIVFEGVYPLYGLSDIRGSSLHRNAAIQADLVEHLRLAQAVLRVGYGTTPLPILDALAYHVGQHMAHLDTALAAGDELTILEFLHRDIEPLFPHLRAFGPEVDETIQAYWTTVEAPMGTLYRRRKEFDDSVMLINETLAAYLDREEDKAQAMFPHYFEQHKSDGVEFGIYVGASLVESGTFDQLYLHNLRLWQLLVMCGMARQAERLKGRLKVPLEVAHLILVQHTPLAIRFRFDEKRFDIDGAYNMRYEIVKKRLDKARIRGTHERLTQPGTIAIVYSQAQEALEYQEYIAYVQAVGYLTQGMEHVELEDLEGAQGLHALRVTVDLHEAREQQGALDDVSEPVRLLVH
jgi:hypothetical protein